MYHSLSRISPVVVCHEKACFVKANVVAITLERLICPVATLPFALSSSPSSATRCMMGSVFSGRRCNLKTGLPPREGQRELREPRNQTLAEQQQQQQQQQQLAS